MRSASTPTAGTRWYRRADICRTGIRPSGLSLPATPGTSTFTAQNLPVYLTGLVGRERDEAAVAALLSEPTIRLLTLTGPGGVGKTRLAVQVAAHLADVCPDGVVFVALAAVSDPTLVLATVAQALGIGDRGELPLLESVLLALRKQQLLLVLDNYEHVLDAAPLVVDLLVGSSNLRILVTSRTLLRVGGEHVFTVSPWRCRRPSRRSGSTSRRSGRRSSCSCCGRRPSSRVSC